MNDFSMVPSLESGWFNQPTSVTKDLIPIMSTDLTESDQQYNVHVDLPGVEPSDLDISIADNFLVIKAERKQVHEETTDRFHSRERAYGKVQRRIRLPGNANVDEAQSKFKNGVLYITFPKKAGEEQAVKKLNISTDWVRSTLGNLSHPVLGLAFQFEFM